MNWFKKIFKRKINGEELESLLSSLGESELHKTLTDKQESPEGYIPLPYAKLDIKQNEQNLIFDLYIQSKYYPSPEHSQDQHKSLSGFSKEIEIGVPYSKANNSPILKKYF